jgi:hypothetical protein
LVEEWIREKGEQHLHDKLRLRAREILGWRRPARDGR